MAEQQIQVAPQRVDQLAGKYLSFSLAEQEYGLEISKVREIIGMQEITAIPRTPDYVRGVINLRGKVIPVLNLWMKLGFSADEQTQAGAIIITQIEDVEIGVLVDAVSEVLEVAAVDIEETPSFGAQIDTSFILALAKTDGRVTILLDLAKIITAAEFSSDESSVQ